MIDFATVENEGVRVTPFGDRHLTARYVSWLNDPHIVRYSEQRHRTHTLKSCASYVDGVRASSTALLLAIEALRPALGHIGNIGLAFDPHNLTADVSILIGEREAHGKALATRAWTAVLRELLVTHGLRKVTAGTMADNIPMLRVMTRSGMHIEGRRARQFVLDGREVDLVQGAIFREGLV